MHGLLIHSSAWKSNSPKFAVTISAVLPRSYAARTGRGRVFAAGSGVVGAMVARIGYERLRLATLTTSENFIKARPPSANRLSAKFALMEFSEVRVRQVSYTRLYEP